MMKYTYIVLIVALGAFNVIGSPINQTDLSNQTVTTAGEIDVPCLIDDDCGKHGTCVNEVCDCKSGYTTNKLDNPCGYEKKSRTSAVLFAFFLGYFGANWFYLARGDDLYIIIGVIKLCLLALGCCDSKEIYTRINDDGSQTTTVKKQYFPSISWWFIDWVLLAANVYNDGNGVGLTG